MTTTEKIISVLDTYMSLYKRYRQMGYVAQYQYYKGKIVGTCSLVKMFQLEIDTETYLKNVR